MKFALTEKVLSRLLNKMRFFFRPVHFFPLHLASQHSNYIQRTNLRRKIGTVVLANLHS